jgi:hypothetical protein
MDFLQILFGSRRKTKTKMGYTEAKTHFPSLTATRLAKSG